MAEASEALTGNRRGQHHSIQINDQWCIISPGLRKGPPMSKSSTATKAIATPNRVTAYPGEVLNEEFLKPLRWRLREGVYAEAAVGHDLASHGLSMADRVGVRLGRRHGFDRLNVRTWLMPFTRAMADQFSTFPATST